MTFETKRYLCRNEYASNWMFECDKNSRTFSYSHIQLFAYSNIQKWKSSNVRATQCKVFTTGYRPPPNKIYQPTATSWLWYYRCRQLCVAQNIPQMRDTAQVLNSIDLSTTRSKLLTIIANERGAAEACTYAAVDIWAIRFRCPKPFSYAIPTLQLRSRSTALKPFKPYAISTKKGWSFIFRWALAIRMATNGM